MIGAIAAAFVDTVTGYAATVLADSPQVFYRMGDLGYNGLLDGSGNSRVSSPVALTFGAAGAISDGDPAITFNGSSSKVDLTYGSWMNVSNMTVEAWVKTTSAGTMAVIDRDKAAGRVFQFRMSGGAIQFILIGTGIISLGQSGTINDGNWHHVAATLDGTTIKIYVDGSLSNSTSQAGVAIPTGSIYMSLGVNSSGGDNAWFNGSIDEAAYYGSALSAARILAHYNAGLSGGAYPATIVADSPLFYYRLGDSAAGLIDESGNARSSSPIALTFGQTGAISDGNKAIAFNGSTSKVDLSYGSWMNTTSLTLEAWVKTTSSGVNLVWDRDKAAGRVFQCRVYLGKFEFLIIGTSVVTATSVASVNDGNWHHVVATVDGTNIKLYIDGVLNKTQAQGGVALPTGAIYSSIGVNTSAGDTGFFNGTLDEMAWYSTVLTAGQIAAHYAAA